MIKRYFKRKIQKILERKSLEERLFNLMSWYLDELRITHLTLQRIETTLNKIEQKQNADN